MSGAPFSDEVRRAAVERALLPLREAGMPFVPKDSPLVEVLVHEAEHDGLNFEIQVEDDGFCLYVREGLRTVLRITDARDEVFQAELFEAVHSHGPVTGEDAPALLRSLWKQAKEAGGKPFVSVAHRIPGHRIVRLATGYELAIAVSPPEAKPDDEDVTFHRWASWVIGGEPEKTWNEVSRDAAMAYFGGMGAGLGLETLPQFAFASLRDAGAFMLTGFVGARKAMLARIAEDDGEGLDP